MLKSTFRTLRYRNYRLFFAGQSISLVGTWIQGLAISWLVYRLTASPFMLGLIGFISPIPTFFFAPFAGVIADRWPRHRLLLITQTLSMLQAGVLAVLVIFGVIKVWEIAVLGFCLGLINAFDIPIRQSFIVEMIEKKQDLGNAIALNSTMVNGARLAGPAIAGLLVAAVGEGWCFAINALSFIAVLASLQAMRVAPSRRPRVRSGHLKAMGQGVKYVSGSLPVRSILILLSCASLVGMPFQVLMPVFAKDIYKGGANTMGFLMSFVGIGALTGTIYLASRKNTVGLERQLPVGAAIFGAALAAFSFTHSLASGWFPLMAAGFGMFIVLTGCNTLIQTLVPDEMRGRVMSFYTMAFMGTVPFGNMLSGIFGSRIGVAHTVLAGGFTMILAAGLFARKLPEIARQTRSVYLERNMIPEPVPDIQGEGQ